MDKYLFLLVLLICMAASCSSEQPPDDRPNIILILADDLGYETMTVNGGESYQTPNIDQLAAQGMRFEHCYAQPQCTQTRVQLLTGIYNVRNYVRFGFLDTSQVTVAQLFREAGYETGIAGKWQLGKNPDNPDQLGFDEYLLWQVTEARMDSIGRDTRYSQPVLDLNGQVINYGTRDYGPEVINEFCMQFIERNNKENKPFFFLYSMMLVHCPFSPTPDSPEWMMDDTTVMDYKGQAHYFDDMVGYMDRMVGNIMAKLEEEGIADHTLVIFTGDNGTDTPIVSRFQGRDVAGAKLLSTDGGTRVPLIARWPGIIEPATLNSDLIDFTDFMPTMLEVAHIRVPDSLDIDGVSFLPQLQGQAGSPRDWIYSWYLSPMSRQPRVFARDHRFKLYDTGEFYDVPSDFLEQHPIPPDSLKDAAHDAYEQLGKVLFGYAGRRLDAIDD